MDTPGGDLRENGTALLRQGKFAEAATVLTDAVSENPNDGTLWSLLGAALSSSGDAPKAVEAFQRAAALTPAAAKSQFNLGVALQATDRAGEAKAAFEKALLLDPGYEQARTKLEELGFGGPAAPNLGTTNLGGGTTDGAGLSSVGASYVPPPVAESGSTNLGGGTTAGAGLSGVGAVGGAASYSTPITDTSGSTTNLGGGTTTGAGLSSVGTYAAPPVAGGDTGTTNLSGGTTAGAGLSGVGGQGTGAPPLRPPTSAPMAPPPSYGGPSSVPPQGNYAPQPQLGMGYAAGGTAPDVQGGQLLAAAIVSLFCFGIILGPYAWINGNKALATLDQYQYDNGQRGNVTAARIIGIVSTVLAVPGIIYLFVVLAAVLSGAGRGMSK